MRHLWAASLTQLALAAAAVLCLSWVFRTQGRRPAFSGRGFASGLFAGSAILLFSLMFLASLFLGTNSGKTPALIVALIAFLWISMSFFEEALFRGLLQGVILRKWSGVWHGRLCMVLLSGLFSAFLHAFIIYNGYSRFLTSDTLIFFSLGIGLSAVYLYSKNLRACVFLHAFYNFSFISLNLFAGSWTASEAFERVLNFAAPIFVFAVIPVFAVILSIKAKPFDENKAI
ncbi:MAG: CPBP family intramembrane metalloprotease [Clostridiales bacterium]|nr:CPBP family intramembrane metalloprotease [Clostridiales bacterium]